MDIDNAYMAGFFDGEGYIGLLKRLRKGKYTEYFLQMAIGQKDGAVMDWVKGCYGGHIHKVKRDGSYFWIASNKSAYEILKRITPYLKYKKPQAILALEFFEGFTRTNRALPPEEFERRERILNALKAEKKIFTTSSL
jgi:hypothetical protein